MLSFVHEMIRGVPAGSPLSEKAVENVKAMDVTGLAERIVARLGESGKKLDVRWCLNCGNAFSCHSLGGLQVDVLALVQAAITSELKAGLASSNDSANKSSPRYTGDDAAIDVTPYLCVRDRNTSRLLDSETRSYFVALEQLAGNGQT